ncbi:MAG: hypothetical protein JXA83_01795 [Acidimicrobiales bacterium]|nr:hypothetical protein [Acidimicrobiales bacterium]
MSRRLLIAPLSLFLVVVLAACNVRTAVTVDVADDGSGTVEVALGLDADAVGRLPDLDDDGASGPADLAALVRADDLVAAGWSVDAPEADADGTTWLRVSRPFGTPAEAEQILAGVAGPDGALRDLRLTRTESFGRTQYEFTGTADLSGGLEAFGDEGLAAALDGEPLGEDAAAIELRAGEPLADVFTFEVVARLPGESTTWAPRLGDGPVEMSSSSTVIDWPVVALAVLAAASAAAVVVVLALRTGRSRRRA